MTESTVAGEAAGTTDPATGLSAEEAEQRRLAGEVNRAPRDSSRSYRRILFDNAFTPINTILFVIAVLLIALGLPGDAVVTAGLVLINVVVGVFQESRAKRQLDEIALLARPKARVVRGGEEREIEPEEIVRGDVLTLQPGDQIQVDGLVLQAEGFSVDEALLTGESDLVRKEAGDEVFSGTFCMTGSARYEAVKVGAGSVANQITARARAFRTVRTPLQREVAWVIWGMGVYVLILGAQVLNSFHNLYGELPLVESVRAAAVIVALVPQGLSFMITATYGMAAVRIGRTGALVQRLNAVESMSHVDVLCLDKTGTLTTNQLKLEAVEPVGVSEDEARSLLGAFTASASVSNRTNEAILAGCGGSPRPVAAEVGFDSARKWSAVQFEGEQAVYVLGAPEMLEAALADAEALRPRMSEWAVQGLRVLLFCRGDAPASGLIDEEHPALPANMRPVALIALSDELRSDARETIEAFAQGGITLKIISGDNPQTVAALAAQAGFGQGLKAVAGPELEGMDESRLEAVAIESTIFGRIAPQHKESLVRALQRRKRYVAMTGDGVNDVPALKQAQVSVAVKSGSPVTRSVADIVLLNDSFAVLPAAFREGQRIRKGMESIIRLFLVRTFAVSLAILGVSVLTDPFPITPRQAGVPALLTVGLPALVLAVWARPGKTGKYLLPSAALFVIPASISIGLVSLFLYHFYLAETDALGEAQTMLVLISTICGITLLPFVQDPPQAWLRWQGLMTEVRSSLLALGMFAILLAGYLIPPMRRFFELEVLPAEGYGALALVYIGWYAALYAAWRVDWDPAYQAVKARVLEFRRSRRGAEPIASADE